MFIVDPEEAAFATNISGIFDNAAGTKPETNYNATTGGKLKNIVDTWKYIPGSAGNDGIFTRPDGVYNMIQFHIHSLSEHRIHKVAYAAEIHCNSIFDLSNSCSPKKKCNCFGCYWNHDPSWLCLFTICCSVD